MLSKDWYIFLISVNIIIERTKLLWLVDIEMLMLLTEVTVAFILKKEVVISLPNILFDIINGISVIIKCNYIKKIKSLLNGVQITFHYKWSF